MDKPVVDHTVTHANGLRLALPKGLSAQPQGEGFVVESDPPLATRSPVRVQVALLAEARPMVDAKTRAPWRYATTRIEGAGSGGDEWTLTACRPAGARWLCLWQTHLGKDTPEFELWTVAAGASAT